MDGPAKEGVMANTVGYNQVDNVITAVVHLHMPYGVHPTGQQRFSRVGPAVRGKRMTELRPLKWSTVVLPVAFIALLHLFTDWLIYPRLSAEMGRVVLTAAVAAGAPPFSTLVFLIIERLQQPMV